jgi:RNA polymerase sigma-70 factor (ECF subfamily)
MGQGNDLEPESLMAQARAGRPEALGQLLELYRNYLTLFARVQMDMQLRGRVSGSDLVQDTFVRACRYFRDFRGTTEEEFLAWLRKIFIRCAASAVQKELKSRKRDVRREISLGAHLKRLERSSQAFDAALVAPVSSPSMEATRRERAALIADELARLPKDYREVIVLRNLEGLSFDEVAKRMGRSAGAVRILWLRALARLRKTAGLEET